MLLSQNEVSSRKRRTMKALLKLIHDQRQVTRKTIEESLGASSSSVAKYVQDLIETGFLIETGRNQAVRGRSPALLELSPSAGVSLAVVIIRSGVKGALVNFNGEITERCHVRLPDDEDRDEIISSLFQCIDCLLERNSDRQRVLGIGVALAGFLDSERGVSHELLFANRWSDVPLGELIEDKYGISAFLMNTANASALSEKHYGLGVGADNVLVVILDEGVGMGIIVRGELYLGSNQYAGEFGHIRVEGNDLQCYCGHTGCLETVSSKNYVVQRCKTALNQNVQSAILRLCNFDIDAIEIEHIVQAANEGDRLARNVFNEVGETIGKKLADAVNVLDPELVILRGGMVDDNEVLYRAIERTVMDYSLRPAGKGLQVLYSKDKTDSRFLGVHAHIVDRYVADTAP